MVHILIADDHNFVRDNLRSVLKEQQPTWEVSEASNGLEAVQLFRRITPDVAVLDIVMEPIGGVGAAFDIRQIDPAAKIVFISSHYTVGEASVVTRLLGAGAFLAKSDAVRLLVPTIKRVLEGNRSGQRTSVALTAVRPHLTPPTILCIDDESDLLEVRRILLEKAGYRVLGAATGRQGIRLFSAERIDLVVLDYWMADMNGLEVAEELKRTNSKVPIVMFSGYRSILDEGIGRVDTWLVKGQSESEDLLSTISELLSRL